MVLVLSLVLCGIPLSRPVMDHVDCIEINIFFDPEVPQENGDPFTRTQMIFWEIDNDGEFRIVDWRWWSGEEVHVDTSGNKKMTFWDSKFSVMRVVYWRTVASTLTPYDPERIDFKKHGSLGRKKLTPVRRWGR